MLVSCGLNLTFGVMRIVNYAHGELLMIGMYLSYWIYVFIGLSPYTSIPIVFVFLFIFCLLLHNYIIEPLLKLPYESQILTFVGLIYLLQNFALVLWSPTYRSVIIEFASQSIDLLSIRIPIGKGIAFLASLLITLLFYVLLKKTTFGLYIRAVSQDPISASMLGINVKKVRLLTFALGGSALGIAAGVMTPLYYVYPFAGSFYTILALVIITLGGLGNFLGTIVGSFIVGFTEAIVGVYISPEISLIIVFIVFISILIGRPSGIAGD